MISTKRQVPVLYALDQNLYFQECFPGVKLSTGIHSRSPYPLPLSHRGIVSAFAHAAYQREEEPEASRKPFFLYVDEFHSFSTSAFADMLSELRKYGLGLIATTQYGARLSETVREALFGNVGTVIAFRVGATDAQILEKQLGGDVPHARDLVGLANHEVYLKMMVDGVQTKPFSARTLPPELRMSHIQKHHNAV